MARSLMKLMECASMSILKSLVLVLVLSVFATAPLSFAANSDTSCAMLLGSVGHKLSKNLFKQIQKTAVEEKMQAVFLIDRTDIGAPTAIFEKHPFFILRQKLEAIGIKIK